MKNSLLKRFILPMLFLVGGIINAQEIKGVVSDSSGGLPGVSVFIKGTTTGTQTDFDGNYSINANVGDVLVFSYLGYKTEERTVGTERVINVTMVEDSTQLDEIVVVGYGSVRKKDATGSVSTIKPKDFNRGVQTSPDQLIQGRIAGVNVTAASGEPGAGSTINIRGASSIRSGNGPLIVVDGVPLSGGAASPGANAGIGTSASRNPLNFINPNDIASVDILKDASAAAIYGSRGANGVILITTKRGKSGEGKLSYATSVATSTISNEYDLLNGDEYVAARIALQGGVASDYDLGARVDAFDDIITTGYSETHDLSYSGGSETGNYRVSLGYLRTDGIIRNSGIEKLTGNITINQRFFDDRLSVTAKIIASKLTDDAAPIADNIGAEGDLITSALRWNPTQALRNPDGSFVQISNNQRNPLALLEYYYDNTQTTRTFVNLTADYKITDALTYKLNVGLDRNLSDRRIGQSRLLGVDGVSGIGRADLISLESESELYEHTLNYVKDVAENVSLNALVGYSYQRFTNKGQTIVAQGFPDGLDDERFYVDNILFATSLPIGLQSSFANPDSELQSFFGRANVNVNEKYLFTATLRADGASNFVGSNEYGYFPSAAFAWRLNEEDFIPEYFDDLKLRLGWGLTGNREFPGGLVFSQVGPLNGQAGNSPVQTIIGNPNLKWETTSQFNVGIDYGFFEGRLTGTIDYFNKNTDDLLFRFRAIQPAPDAFFWQNLSDVEVNNSGLELGISAAIVQSEDFNWDVNINASFLSNEISNVSGGFPAGIRTGNITGQGLSNETAQLLWDGQELYAFFLPIFEGFDASGAPIFADINGDGIINTGQGAPGEVDRTFVGSPNPDVLLGIQSAMNYKNWDFSVYLNGAFGHQVYDNTATALFSAGALGQGANVTTDIVTSGESVAGSSVAVSTRYLQDADFLRLSNLTIGYNFKDLPKWISSARLSVTGQNLFVITGYDGFDPEVNTNKAVDGVPSFGIDFTSYPRARTVQVGLNVAF
jgi:iron complex outermembrane receptor protein